MFYSAAKVLFYKILLAEIFSQPSTAETIWLYLGP